MSDKAPRVRVSAPTADIPFGRGFYQLEEEILYLPIEYPGEKSRFFSYLESSDLSLQMDREGRLIFIELSLPRRRWIELPEIPIIEGVYPADIRFLDFRERISNPAVFCDKYRQTISIAFSTFPVVGRYFLAKNLIAMIAEDDTIVNIQAGDIVDDIAGRELAAWRKSLRAAAARSIPVQS
jgi:hypothetical protein